MYIVMYSTVQGTLKELTFTFNSLSLVRLYTLQYSIYVGTSMYIYSKHLIKEYENSFSANCLLKTEHSMLIIE